MSRVLVLGKGGREHAIVKKLSQSRKVKEINVMPGNYGTKEEPKTTNISDAKLENYDLVVIGPESRLAQGWADMCLTKDVKCFGPTKECALIETSKVFAKTVMDSFNIPTADYHVLEGDFTHEAQIFLNSLRGDPVIKRNCLCGGKGVFLPRNPGEVLETLEKYQDEVILLEERLYGQEVTVMAFTDGKTVKLMPPVKDYKRLQDCDNGPNTGSMGSFCPYDLLTDEQMRQVENSIQKVVDHFGGKYVGVLYAGLMVTPSRVDVLEFNARFGDSEAQVVLALLETDLYDIMMACCNGTLHQLDIEYSDQSAVIVNVATEGYPDNPKTGYKIPQFEKSFDERLQTNAVYEEPRVSFSICAGINDKGVVTGGRVLGRLRIADTVERARSMVYFGLNFVKFPGMQYRTDIARYMHPTRIVVMGSTRGTDLGYLYEAIDAGKLNAKVVAVVSNKENAYILQRARNHNTPIFVTDEDQEPEYILDELRFDLVVLIGYMKILSNKFVNQYENKIINVHPSLLPAFAGGMDTNVHKAVLKAGVKVTGCTVHMVTEVVDGGTILVQKYCDVLPEDTVDTLKAKVQKLEGVALTEAIQLYPYIEEEHIMENHIYPVDIDGGNELVNTIRKYVENTYNKNVISPWGAFAGCYDVSELKKYRHPVLVSSVDSVGSKILLSNKYKDHLVGHDIVHHCVNDILVMGAKPLFFLDYIASARLVVDHTQYIVNCITVACKKLNLPLIGGETAEIREMFKKDAVDLVGMIVGVVEKDQMITGEKIKEGDIVLGIESSGFHTNGYSLVNKYASEENVTELLEPHRCYYDDLKDRLQHVHGLVHLTGGGWIENPKRILPKKLAMEINKKSWEIPRLFKWIQKRSGMSSHEMYKTFNMGIGMLVIIPEENREHFADLIKVGEIKKRKYYPVEMV